MVDNIQMLLDVAAWVAAVAFTCDRLAAPGRFNLVMGVFAASALTVAIATQPLELAPILALMWVALVLNLIAATRPQDLQWAFGEHYGIRAYCVGYLIFVLAGVLLVVTA